MTNFKLVSCILIVGMLCIGSVNGLVNLPRTFDDSLGILSFTLDTSRQNQQFIDVSPGQTINGRITFQRWSGMSNPNEVSQVFLLYSWSSLPPRQGQYTPLYDGSPGVYPGVTQTKTFSITAPNTPGTYYVWAYHKAAYSMQDAINEITRFPYSTADAIGEITVRGSGGDGTACPVGTTPCGMQCCGVGQVCRNGQCVTPDGGGCTQGFARTNEYGDTQAANAASCTAGSARACCSSSTDCVDCSRNCYRSGFIYCTNRGIDVKCDNGRWRTAVSVYDGRYV